MWNMSGSLFRKRGGGVGGGWQHCRMTMFVVFPPSPELISLHRKKERREWGGLYGETSSCRFCGSFMNALVPEAEDFVVDPLGDWQPVQRPQGRGSVIQRLCSGHRTGSSHHCRLFCPRLRFSSPLSILLHFCCCCCHSWLSPPCTMQLKKAAKELDDSCSLL